MQSTQTIQAIAVLCVHHFKIDESFMLAFYVCGQGVMMCLQSGFLWLSQLVEQHTVLHKLDHIAQALCLCV